MFLNMILGSSTETPLASGRVGIRIRGFTSGFRESRLVLVSELVSLAGLAGDGDTGDTIGITASFSTTTPTSPTAESSPIAATSITLADFTERVDSTVLAGFMAEMREDSHRTPMVACTPERSAVLTTAEPPEDSHHAGSRASEVGSTAVVASMGAEVSTGAVVIGDLIQPTKMQVTIWRKISCARPI